MVSGFSTSKGRGDIAIRFRPMNFPKFGGSDIGFIFDAPVPNAMVCNEVAIVFGNVIIVIHGRKYR